MGSPRVSVVMAVRNEERFAAAAIDSILAQTFEDFEFVIVDDGSTDATLEVVKGYSDERIRIVEAAGSGLAAALNRGIDASRGEFIARMDGDDLSAPQRLEIQLAAALSMPQIGLLGAQHRLIDEVGTFLSDRRLPVSDADLRTALETGNPFVHGTAFITRKAVDAVGGYRTQFRSSQDLDLWLRISEKFPIGNVPERLYSLRLRRGAVGSRGRMTQRAYGRAARECARQRRRGEPEHLPGFDSHSTAHGPRLTGRLLAESTYHARRANALLPDRVLLATGSALKAVAWAPWNVVALAALARAITRPLPARWTPESLRS